MADPQDITTQPDGSVVDLRWAEPTAVVVEPTSGRKDTGFLTGDAPPDDDFNWMHRETGRWLRAMWSRYLKASDAFFSSWLPTGTDVYWVDVPAQPLKVFLSPDGVGSAVAVVWVDPEDVDTGAVQVQVSVPLADPQTLTATKDNYVFVPNTMVGPPTVTRVELAFLAVDINDPAPATPAGMVPVWKITTDAAAIDSVTLLVPETPSIKLTDFTDTVTITVGNDNALIATSTANATGVPTVFLTSFEGPALLAQNVSATDATISCENPLGKVFDGVGDWNLVGDADIDGDLAVTAYFTADSVLAYNGIVSGSTIQAYGNITTYGDINVSYDAFIGGGVLSQLGIASNGYLTVQEDVTLCAGTGSFVCLIGTSSADTLTSAATATFSSGVNLCTGSGTFTCTIGTSSADALAVAASATFSAPVAVTANDAVQFLIAITNAGVGGGLYSFVAGGHAGYFRTDTTSATHAALHIEPQDADPSSPVQGDIYHHVTRGKLRQRHFSQWESVHSSTKGHVFGCTATADQVALAGTTGNVAGVVIEPEVTGNVLVTGSFVWFPTGDTDTVTFILRDNTAGVNLTSQIIRAKDVDGSGARGETVILRRVYALPSTASRTFVLNITTSAAADVNDIVLSVEGVV